MTAPSPNAQDASAAEVAVVVPAAGRGTRLGGERKQFRRLGKRSLLAQTLRVFERCAAVGSVVVAGPRGETDAMEAALRTEGAAARCAVVPGGASRQASVAAALAALPDAVRIVLVHDAVRPFVEAARVQRVVEAARTHGAAALAVPVADTLRRAGDGAFGETVPRRGLYRMQTPQGFRRAWLTEAHASASDPPATDDVELVQRLGHRVRLVEGSAHNFKITTPADWRLAQELWPGWAAAL